MTHSCRDNVTHRRKMESSSEAVIEVPQNTSSKAGEGLLLRATLLAVSEIHQES